MLIPDAAVVVDASIDTATAPCDLTKPFGVPVGIAGLNTPENEWSARPSMDGLSMYLAAERSGGPGGRDIFLATRAAIDDPFGEPARLAGLNSANMDSEPAVTPDRQTIYLTRQTAPDGPQKIFVSRWSTSAGQFESAVLEPTLDGPGGHTQPFLSIDGNSLYFYRGDSDDIVVASHAQSGWSPATFVLGGGFQFPVVTADELTMFAAQHSSPDEFDIVVATRRSKAETFGAPALVSELNRPSSIQIPAFVSGDGCSLLFASNGHGGAGGADIFRATRPR
jgi:hypothetical protein